MYKIIAGVVLILVIVFIGLKIKKVDLSRSDAAYPPSTVSEQRSKIKHKNVKISEVKENFPEIKLTKKSRQREAIAELGERLPEVAAWYGMSASEFEKTLLSDKTAWLDEAGQLFHIEELTSSPDSTNEVMLSSGSMLSMDSTIPIEAGTVSTSQTFLLHSSPNSKKLIYLDFDGGQVNLFNYPSTVVPPFDMDGSPGSFSTSEHQMIQEIWQRVAEDYIPFDIDVTTEVPSEDRILRSSTTDEYFGVPVVITPMSSTYCGVVTNCGGIAYTGAFYKLPDYLKPALVFSDTLRTVQSLAVAISHEAAHTLGQNHDGTTTSTYYGGHGGETLTGSTSWGPIMGNPLSRNLTQWSKGEYTNANNKYDDILYNLERNLGYYPDDVGNSISNAKNLSTSNSLLSAYGVIERSSDIDVFSFTTTGGDLSITASPALYGPNLDIKMELLDGQGSVIAVDNNTSTISATISKSLTAGTYYITIDGVGRGDPLTGYSDYASLGQYKISGTITTTPPPTPAPVPISDIINPPSNLTAAASNKVVTLKWLDKSNNEEGFYIERALNGKKPVYQRVAEVTANSTQFTQTVTAATYLYRIQAFNKTTGKISGYSNSVTIRVK